jgi:DNA-binding CsgD family transcriptional regulator
MGSLETRHETWRELVAIGLVAGDVSVETVARCARVSRLEVTEAFRLAMTHGVMDADGYVAAGHASRLVDELASEVASAVHAEMARLLLSGGLGALAAAVEHARQVTTAHDTDTVIGLCDHFGEVNLSLGDYASARALLELARDLDLSRDDQRHGHRLLVLARALDGCGDVHAARELLRQAVIRGERAGDVQLVVDAACLHVLPADWYAGDQQAVGLLGRADGFSLDHDQAVRLMAARGLAEMRLPLQSQAGQHAAWITRPEVAQPLTQRALDESATLSPDTRVLALLAWRSTHRAPAFLERRCEVSEELLMLGNALRRADLQVDAAVYLATDALEMGDRVLYDKALGVARWVAARDGNPRLQWRADTLAAGGAYLDGAADDALQLVAAAEATGRAVGSPRVANTRAFFLAQHLRAVDDPLTLVEASNNRTSALLENPLTAAVVAWALARGGDREQAEHLARRSLRQVDMEASGLFLLTRLSDVALAMSSHDLVRDLIERLTPWGRHVSVDSNAWWCDGPVALWLATLHHACGETDRVAEWMTVATPLIDNLGDSRSRRRLHGLEHQVSAGHVPRDSHDLTKRELHVLRYMSMGATNADIARELGVSVSTVRHDTMVIYRKLSVTGRAEAVVRAYALRLIVRPGQI